MSKKDHEVFLIGYMLPINPNCIQCKSHNDICSKNHHNISDEVGIQ